MAKAETSQSPVPQVKTPGDLNIFSPNKHLLVSTQSDSSSQQEVTSTSDEHQVTVAEEAAGGEAAPGTQLGETGEGDPLTSVPILACVCFVLFCVDYPVVFQLPWKPLRLNRKKRWAMRQMAAWSRLLPLPANTQEKQLQSKVRALDAHLKKKLKKSVQFPCGCGLLKL